MKQGAFIQKNQVKWKAFESFLNNKTKLSPDELADYYVELIDDLSYTQSSYPNSKLEQYLNNLAIKAHQRIYKTKKEDSVSFFKFFTHDIPLAIKASHRDLSISLITFLIAIAIGLISSYIEPDFPRLILGDSYVNMTMANIEKGDPMAVYRSDARDIMFFQIGSNNLRVSVISYVLGLVGAIFAGFIVFSNGIVVGAFQYLFVRQGLFWVSFSTIFIHGALELSAIVIVAGAGMVLGNSWWYPGTYSRLDSLSIGAKKSIKIVIAILPVIVLAAILESYVTHRYQDMSDLTRGLIIFLSFAYIIWFFIIYPNQVYKSVQEDEN